MPCTSLGFLLLSTKLFHKHPHLCFYTPCSTLVRPINRGQSLSPEELWFVPQSHIFRLFRKKLSLMPLLKMGPNNVIRFLLLLTLSSTLSRQLMPKATPSQVSTPVLILREHDRRGAIFWTCKMMLRHGEPNLSLLGNIDSDSI